MNAWESEYQTNTAGCIYEPLWKDVSQAIETWPQGTLIDFGCGDGRYSQLLHAQGFKVIGIDSSTSAITLAKKDLTQGNTNLEYLIHDDIPAAIPNQSITGVVMLNSFHCIAQSKRQQIMHSVMRVLAEHGRLFMSVLTQEDESFPRHSWTKLDNEFYDDGTGKQYQFFSEEQIIHEIEPLKICSLHKLENMVPQVGRKSSLYVLTAQKSTGLSSDHHFQHSGK